MKYVVTYKCHNSSGIHDRAEIFSNKEIAMEFTCLLKREGELYSDIQLKEGEHKLNKSV